MAATNGKGEFFAVEMTASAREQVLQIGRHGTYAGRGRVIAAAMQQLVARLSREARDYGEPSYHLKRMKFIVRRAAVSPLVIEYGVHETEPLVIIRHVALLPGR